MDNQKTQEFIEEYNALCLKYDRRVAGILVPVPTNHGTYELSIQLQIIELEKPKNVL